MVDLYITDFITSYTFIYTFMYFKSEFLQDRKNVKFFNMPLFLNKSVYGYAHIHNIP